MISDVYNEDSLTFLHILEGTIEGIKFSFVYYKADLENLF